MTIHSDKFSDKGLENNVGKSVMHSDKVNLRERGFTEVTSLTLTLQLRMEKEKTARIHQENKDSETVNKVDFNFTDCLKIYSIQLHRRRHFKTSV